MPHQFTPEKLIEAPRRTPLVPNHAGTHAFYTSSAYSIAAKCELYEVKIVNLDSREDFLFSDNLDVRDVSWLHDNTVMWCASKDGGKSELWAGSVVGSKNAYQIGTIGAPITEIKTKFLADGKIALVFNAAADPEGKLLNPEEQPKPRTTAREFETVNIRYWADWTDSYRKSLFYTTIEKNAESGQYKLHKDPPVNALLGTDIDYPWTHHAPFGEGGEYSVSATGIVFTALDPSNSLAEATILAKVWYIPLTTFRESPAPQLRLVQPSPDVPFDGSAENLAFSPDGKKIAFTMFSDKSKFIYCPRRVLVASIDDERNARYVRILDPSPDNEKDWDYWGGSLLWSSDGCALYYTVGFHARTNIYKIPVGADIRADIAVRPEELTSSGSVTAAFRLGQEDSALLLTVSSFIDSSTFVKLSLSSKEQHVLSSATQAGNLFGISAKQVTQFTVPVAHYKVQAWLITPPDMDKTKKYPLVVSVHGGPQVALPDAWSTRWNPLLTASQGYVVLIPNYSGSSTFGQEFEDSVGEGWGARPYDDVVACFEHVEQNCPFVDTSRSVAMGGSFGGYFMNWMAGQPLGAKMKALVCHNGIWNLAGMYASDSPVGLRIEFSGTLWENRKHWEKYDPALFVQNWKTPMLFIHSDKDFRCPIEQGIAPYMICQIRGIPSRFLNFPDETHWVLKRENSLQWHKTVYGWINKYIGNTDGIQLEAPLSEPVKKHSVRRENGKVV